MNIIFISSLITLLFVGLALEKYWGTKFKKLIQSQSSSASEKNALDTIHEVLNSDVKISTINRPEKIGSEYFDRTNNEFVLSTESFNHNSASITIGYFLCLMKLGRFRQPSYNFNLLVKFVPPILRLVFIIFSILLIVFNDISYLLVILFTYSILITFDIVTRQPILTLSNSKTESFLDQLDTASDKEKENLRRFIHVVKGQVSNLLIFSPLLTIYYFVLLTVKK